ncbi:MAG TPA: hypothetical protein VK395_03260 [Gemmataceae bacterium]|nr:hypothetical protein [Gemmataceae bacterium]
MPASTVVCPECQTVLKLASTIHAGKKIKCPKCESVFSLGEGDDQGNCSFTRHDKAAPTKPPRGRREVDEDLEDEPESARESGGRAAPPAELEEEPDDDRETEEEFQPRRKVQRKRFKAKKKETSRGTILAIVLGALFLFLLAGGGLGFYLFMTWDKNRGRGDEDLLAYVPADSQVICGFDFKTMMSEPSIASWARGLAQDTRNNAFFEACRKETGLEFEQLFDHAVLAIKNPDPKNQRGAQQVSPATYTLVARSSVPFDQNKVSKAAREAKAKKNGWKTYFQISEPPYSFLFMPSNRTMVLSSVSEGQMETMINTGGANPVLPATALELIRSVEHDHFWAIFPNPSGAGSALFGGQQGPEFLPPNVKEMLEIVAKAKGLLLRGNFGGSKAKLSLHLHCADKESAVRGAELAQSLWDQDLKGAANPFVMATIPAEVRPLIDEFLQSTQFATQGTTAQMTSEISLASLAAAMKYQQKQNLQVLQRFGNAQ